MRYKTADIPSPSCNELRVVARNTTKAVRLPSTISVNSVRRLDMLSKDHPLFGRRIGLVGTGLGIASDVWIENTLVLTRTMRYSLNVGIARDSCRHAIVFQLVTESGSPRGLLYVSLHQFAARMA